MIKKLFLSLILLMALTAQSFAVNGQIVATSDDAIIIPAAANKIAVVQSLAVIATSGTAVQFYFYNGDTMLLGNSAHPLTVDLDGGDGPAGFILPRNEEGWFQSDTVNEAIQINLSSATTVIVVLNYRYITVP